MIEIMSKLINLYQKNGAINSLLIERARKLLVDGNVIAIPTDTIYGFACSALNSDAIQQLYRIKSRHFQKPFAICVADIEDISKWCRITVETDLLRDLLPGAVTLVFERSAQLNAHLNPNTNLVGVRIPNYDLIRCLCRVCGPLALTSANISSHSSSLTIDEFKELWPQLSLVIDGGSLAHCDPQRVGSTVVDLSVNGVFKIIRDGCALKHTLLILEDKYGLTRRS